MLVLRKVSLSYRMPTKKQTETIGRSSPRFQSTPRASRLPTPRWTPPRPTIYSCAGRSHLRPYIHVPPTIYSCTSGHISMRWAYFQPYIHVLHLRPYIHALEGPTLIRERAFFIDNLLVRNHFIIVMIRWTGLAPWEFEFPFPGSLTSFCL